MTAYKAMPSEELKVAVGGRSAVGLRLLCARATTRTQLVCYLLDLGIGKSWSAMPDQLPVY